MYKVAFVVSSGEFAAFPWMNLKTLFPGSKQYEFVLFQKEQCARLFSEMELGAFDGVVFSSNVSNDDRARELILSKKDVISRFVEKGKGILVLMQYHLAQANRAFDILNKELFGCVELAKEDLSPNTSNDNLFGIKHLSEEGSIQGRAQNSIVCTNNQLDPSKVYFDSDSILLSYPNKISLSAIYEKSQNCRFVRVFAPAYISFYPHAYFSAPLCLTAVPHESATTKRDPLIIYSGNESKRVVITTLPLDLQEQSALLENLISYIVRGRPEAILWKDNSCSTCRGKCDTQDYLNKAKVHYVDVLEQDAASSLDVINRAKYIVACSDTAFSSYRRNITGISLPIKTSLRSVIAASKLANDQNRIVDVPSVSQIEMWANQGFDYLLDRFPQNNRLDNKWDTLYATRQVVLLAKEINRSIPNYICEQISRYLKSHNKDDKSFDKVARASYAAADICEVLGIPLTFERDPQYTEIEPEIKGDISSYSLVDLAQHVIVTKDIAKINEIYQITARFISERNAEKASWDDDILTTASVLRALVKIDRCDQVNTTVTNVVCSCYQNSYGSELSSSLSASIERARQSEYDVRLEYEKFRIASDRTIQQYKETINEKIDKITSISEEKEKMTASLTDAKELTGSLKNRNSRLTAWLICTAGLLAYGAFLIISFILSAQKFDQTKYLAEVNSFFISWGIGGAIVDVLGIIVAIVLFRVLYSTDILRKRRNSKKSP